MANNQIVLNARAVARTLGVVAILLVVASLLSQLTRFLLGHDRLYGLLPLFYLDREQNIPTLFSVLLLCSAALLLTVITLLKRKEKDPDTGRWATLAVGFLAMAVDEASSIHEKLIAPVRVLLGEGPFGIFYFAWVIPGIAVAFLAGLFFLGFLQRLPPKMRFNVILAGALFLGGTLGLELVGGRYVELHGDEDLGYCLLTTAEEGLEMAGIIVFIYALLEYIASTYGDVQFRLMGQTVSSFRNPPVSGRRTT